MTVNRKKNLFITFKAAIMSVTVWLAKSDRANDWLLR
jgi:hypothetical protein